MSTLVAYIAIFIGAGIIGIANGAPLNPLQILWLNMVVDIPLAIALGFDQPARGLMARPPRPVGAPVLSRNNWFRLLAQGAVMTVGSLVAYQIGDDQDGAVVAATMLLTTLSLFHVAGALLCRDQLNTIFDRDAVPGGHAAAALRLALLAIVLVTALDFLQRIFDTTGLSFNQWCICVGIAASIVVVEELIKLVLRRQRTRRRPEPPRCPPDGRRPTSTARTVGCDRTVGVGASPPREATHPPRGGVDPPAARLPRSTGWRPGRRPHRERGANDDDVHGVEVRGPRRARTRPRPQGAERDGLVKIVDHAVMSWPTDADKPKTHHAHDDPKRGAGWGALWGVLTGALFMVPVVGGVVGVAIGALAKSTEGTGITKDDLPGFAPRSSRGRRRCSWSPRRATSTGWANDSVSRQEADLHQPHRGRTGNAAGDLRRGLTLAPSLRVLSQSAGSGCRLGLDRPQRRLQVVRDAVELGGQSCAGSRVGQRLQPHDGRSYSVP